MSGINNDPRGENREAAPEQKGKKLGELKKKVQKVPLLRRLARNPFLKLLSLVFAIILWAMVMSQTNPDRTKVVYDVPLEITGLTELNARGLSLATESDELPSTVDVHLEVPMNDLSRATTDNRGLFAAGEPDHRLRRGNVLVREQRGRGCREPHDLRGARAGHHHRHPVGELPPGQHRRHALAVPDHRP